MSMPGKKATAFVFVAAALALCALQFSSSTFSWLFQREQITHHTDTATETPININININTTIPILSPHDLVYHEVRNTVPIVNEEYKIIFFQVAKAASSQFTRFFMRLEENPSWCSDDYHLHDRNINQLIYLTDFPSDEAQNMLTSDEWIKAIFVRHPKPRLLSAFLDKAVDHTDHFGNSTCSVYASKKGGSKSKGEDLDLEECIEKHQDFSFFLENITTTLKQNVHWRSIYSRIDEKWWPFVNYVGYMDTLSRDAETFLKQVHSRKDGVSAWDRIGKSGWGDDERDCSGGELPFFAERNDHHRHQTNAKEKMLRYYTPATEKFVESHFADDLNNRFFSFEKLDLFDGPTNEVNDSVILA
jgi:hypothetical protein